MLTKTFSTEEDYQRQDKLQEAYKLITVIQQQLNEKEQENLVLKNEINALRTVESILYAQTLIKNREQHIYRQQSMIEELIAENSTLKEEKPSNDREVARLERETQKCECLSEQICLLKAVNEGRLEKEESNSAGDAEEVESSVSDVEEQSACSEEEAVLGVDGRSSDGEDDEDDEFFEFDDKEPLSSEEDADEMDESENYDQNKPPLFQNEDD
ncbi:hypothetical protein K501DRAFT_334173 [Backusella circina FSU 941]|nr:hypothetical protein K501DRAFT_334173 [Backusella circina FSU 941]